MRLAWLVSVAVLLLGLASSSRAQQAEPFSLLPLPTLFPPVAPPLASDRAGPPAQRRPAPLDASQPPRAAFAEPGADRRLNARMTQISDSFASEGVGVGETLPVPAGSPVSTSPSLEKSMGLAPGEFLGGSPYSEALNTSGVPPLAMPWGVQFRPGFWFGSLSGLIMTRDAPNALSTTYNASNVNTNLLDTGMARSNWAGGGQVMFGRWFGPQAYGLQFIYWGVGTMSGFANVADPNHQLSTPLNLGNVNIGSNSATFYFDNAYQHAIWRSDSFNNFEWNALRRAVFAPAFTCGAPRLLFTGIAGVRYFRFTDNLIFGSVNSPNFSDDGGALAGYLNTGVTNSLVGFQVGARVDYFVLPRVRLYAMPKFGLYGNQVNMREHLYSGDGQQGFDVLARRSTVSTIGQVDVGAGYQITPRFSAYVAYRLMGVTRVGLADNQIPPFLADRQSMQNIKTNGDLILHGVLIGGMYNF
ncbi:MAG TPA: BBP7 family outer membrane beta-barrel protein [Pirellulales bacterium]|nr:BBP7 family outer membrane beta-barrel protein [Pirellulales bacterium]